MKTVLRGKFFALLIIVCTAATHQVQAIPSKPANAQLQRIEVGQNSLGAHLLFDFVQNTSIKPHYEAATQTLSIFFAGISPHDLQEHEHWSKLDALRTSGLLNTIELDDPDKATRGSTVRLCFAKTITAKDQSTQENKLVVQWSLIETRGTRLIINAMSKHALEEISKQGASVLFATNDVVQNDFSVMSGISAPKHKPTDRRVVIDAGHGGSDHGAIGCGNRCEKDIALQVSKLLAKKLKASGYNVHLTRNDDRNVSLANRSSLANQLKADAFISIHLNSSGKIGSNATGVETYFLAKDGMLPPTHVGGYYFVNTEHNQKLIDAMNKQTRKKIEGSKLLATHVQNQLISTLRSNEMPVKDRGVKSAHLRLLLRNNMPTALVEIGFITNKQEAAYLATEEGQNTVVDGVVRGLSRYFAHES